MTKPDAASAVCPDCGTDVTAGARFCRECGGDVSELQSHADTQLAPPRLTGDPVINTLREATLGKYDIQGLLGQGGMALVYKGHHLSLDRKVAIKVMSPTLFGNATMVARFDREAKTAASLSHPNIIPVYDVAEGGGLHYFVMKYVKGESLQSAINQVIAERQQFDIRSVQALTAQVGDALAYAHRKGVIHRDVKPANVMIDDEGWAIVTDFGIAKVLDAAGITGTDQMLGTPLYMSPEQCNMEAPTAASDQYSLGVLAYEMLTLRLPFQGNIYELLHKHRSEPPPPLDQFRPDCPAPLRDAVMRMLAKDPAHRFPDLDTAVRAIDAPQLAIDDPARTTLVDLAISGAALRERHIAVTPQSPIPSRAARTPSPGREADEETVAVSRKRSGVRWVSVAVLTAAAVVAGILLTPRFIADRTDPASSATTAIDPVELATGAMPDSQPATGVPAEPEADPPAAATADSAAAAMSPRQRDDRPAEAQPSVEAVTEDLRTEPAAAIDTSQIRLDRAVESTVALTPPAQPEVVPATAILRLRLQPWANVTIGGVALGRRVSFVDTLTAGEEHALRIERPGFATKDTTIVLEPGETRSLTIRIVRNDLP